MTPDRVSLVPVDGVEVVLLVDNYVDSLLESDRIARRPARPYDYFERDKLRAEHGLSILLRIQRAGSTQSVIYDAGLGADSLIHNMDVVGVTAADLRAIVISHGHSDHHGGLEGFVRRSGIARLPLIIHPDAWRERKLIFPTGAELRMPPPRAQDLLAEGVQIVEERGSTLLLDETVLVTGQVERVTEFETGYPIHYARIDDAWLPDPWVHDDQAIAVHVRDRGLVVISGCSHAGIINIIRHVQRVTDISRVHAVVGGLHLTGGIFDERIQRTVSELAALEPAVIVPTHCTGWKAIHNIAAILPKAYEQPSVGTVLTLGAL